MKRVEAIIRPERLEDVKEALIALGHAGLTVIEVKGHGVQKGIIQQWRGQEYKIDLLPKVAVIAVVEDDAVHEVAAAIQVYVAVTYGNPIEFIIPADRSHQGGADLSL